jgi:putative glycosyl hydrolase-like family 15 (GHL15) protein
MSTRSHFPISILPIVPYQVREGSNNTTITNRQLNRMMQPINMETNGIMNSTKCRWIGSSLAFFALSISSLADAQAFKETFPRIGAYEIGSGLQISDPNYRQAVARNDILILGMWRRWSKPDDVTGKQLSIRDVVVDIRRRAALAGNSDIRIGKYSAINESSSDPNNNASKETWDKLHSEIGPGYPVNNDWYARTKTGENTSSFSGTWHANLTEYVKRDSNGDTYPEWLVENYYKEFFRDIPEFDMWYFDNWFYRPRVKADWDGNGSNDDKNSESVRRAFRKGYVNALNRVRKLDPGLMVMGNVDGEVSTNDGMLTEPEFKGKLTALYEGAIGLSYSAEGWGGWELMMQQYQTTLRNAQQNILLMTVHGAKDDYALMRYGLASCLMDDGYYYYTSIKNQYRSALWFDEYDVELGRAVDPPQFGAWKSGVYMRRFENGMVLVNPKGNGRQTIQIGSGYQRLKGTQDPKTNNGKIVDSVTLSERDGLILIKSGDFKKNAPPKPPVLSFVSP